MQKPIGLDDKIAEAEIALMDKRPVCLYGPSGTGKTIAGWEVANRIAERLGNRVVYFQLYPEVTKNSIIGGETIKNGNIVVDTGPILKFGSDQTEAGAVIFVDEATHATEPALLAFNSLIEDPFTTVVGSDIHRMHENTRFIFAGNTPNHSGNIPLPTSFANRLYVIDFPAADENHLQAILENTVGVKDRRNNFYSLQELVIRIAVKTRTNNFVISPRNVMNCVRMLQNSSGSGFKNCPKEVDGDLRQALKKMDMDPKVVKRVILATMQGNIVTKGEESERVKAMLWE